MNFDIFGVDAGGVGDRRQVALVRAQTFDDVAQGAQLRAGAFDLGGRVADLLKIGLAAGGNAGFDIVGAAER